MANTVTLTINGESFNYPLTGAQQWGADASGWAEAVTSGALFLSGGNFALTSDVNFGPTFGLISPYFKSTSPNISVAGLVRLAVGDTINFRNNADSADLALGVNGTDQLMFNGNVLLTVTGTLGNSEAVVTNSSGVLTTLSSVSSTQVGFLSSVSSALSGNSDTATYTNKTWHGVAVAPQFGGTGLNSSSSTGVPSVSSGTWSIASLLSSLLGGTGLNTSASTGYPSISSGTWSVASVAATFISLFQTVASAAGDLIIGGASGTPTRLAIGTSGQVPTSNGTTLAWANSAKLVVQATLGPAGGYTTSSTSLAAFGASTAAAPTVLVSDSNFTINTGTYTLPQITITSAPAGKYLVVFSADLNVNTGAARTGIAVSDGTTNGPIQTYFPTAPAQEMSVDVTAAFVYASAGTRTFSLFGLTLNGTDTLGINTGGTNGRVLFVTITYYP